MQRRIVSICLALVILVAMLPLAAINTFATTSNNIMYEMREENIEFRLSDGTLYYTNTISYPYFMGSSAAEIKINSKYAAIIERHRNNTTDFDALYQEALEWSPNGVNGLPFYDDVFAEVTYCDNGVISIKERLTMWSGGAHPYSEFSGYTYRISDGRELSLNEIITGTEKEIRALVDQHKQGVIDYRDAEAIMAAPYILTNEGLCFMCNVGDAVPPAEVVIPYTDSSSYIISSGSKFEAHNQTNRSDEEIKTIDALNALLVGVRYIPEKHKSDVSQWTNDTICDTIYGKLLWDDYHNSDLSYLSNIGLDYQNGEDWYLHYDLELIQKITQDTLGRSFPDDTQSENIFVSGDELLIVEAIGESTSLSVQDFAKQGDMIIAVGTVVHNYNAYSEFLGYFQAVFEEKPSSVYGYTLRSLNKIDGNQSFSKLTASASSELIDSTGTYCAGNVLDSDLSTAWVESVRGVGINEWIKLNTSDGSKMNISAIEFSMGYQKNDQLLQKNGWPYKILVECEGEYRQEAEFYEYTDIVVLDQSVTTSWIKITILQAAAGLKYDDTSISEICLRGVDATTYFLEYFKENPGENNSVYEDYARTEWIEQHMEYAASDEFEHEIVRGFTGSLNDLFIEIRDDSTIKAYSTLDSVNQILSFDIDLSESQEYELLLAQIFFSYIGEDAIEEIYAENLTKAVIELGEEVLKLDDFKQIGDSDQLKGILNALKSAKGAEEMNAACDSFFNFVDGYDNLDIKKHLADNIKKESFNLVWDVAIDSLDLVTTTLRELTMYVAVGEAYARTSNAFGEVLLTMRRNIGIPSDNPVFSPLPVENVVTNDVIWRLIGNNNSPYPDPLNTPVVLKDLATAIEDFYTSIETYKNEDSTYIAQAAIADLQHGAVNDVLINNGANAAVSLFSCLPVVREYKIIKDILATGQSVIDLMTSIDDQEYLGTMLMRLYCISYLHCLSVDSLAGTPEAWNMVSIDLDNYTPGSILTATDDQDLYEYQFKRATKFDESINVYKSISVVAADYAMKYVDLFLADAISELEAYDEGGFLDRFLKNRDDLVRVVTQYKNSLKKLEDQKTEIQAIVCHDADLQYDSETDEIIYNFKDSRIYIVACPVDVVVTTDTGDQIAYLSGEENEVAEGYEFYFHTIKATDDSGEYIKVAIVPDGYQIELKGTDDGTMHAFVADFTDGEVGEVETYFNIPIEKGSEGYFEVGADDANCTSLVMDQVTYSNMESADDIPTDSGSNGVWIWIVAGVTVCGILVLVLLKKKSRK